MKMIVSVLAAFICLQATAQAVPDSVTTGPYMVSFDLGLLKDAYSVSANLNTITITYGSAIGPSITIKETGESTLPPIDDVLSTLKISASSMGLRSNEYDAGIREMYGSKKAFIHYHKPGVRGMQDGWMWVYYPLPGTEVAIAFIPELTSDEFMMPTLRLVDSISVEMLNT